MIKLKQTQTQKLSKQSSFSPSHSISLSLKLSLLSVVLILENFQHYTLWTRCSSHLVEKERLNFSWLESLRVWSDCKVKSLEKLKYYFKSNQNQFCEFIVNYLRRVHRKKKLLKMNMRQQRITTSQQEVYLIYLMEHTDFAASRIKDGDFCCKFFRFLFLFTYFLRLCVGNVLSLHVYFLFFFLALNSQVNRNTKKIGKNSLKCWIIRLAPRKQLKSGKW